MAAAVDVSDVQLSTTSGGDYAVDVRRSGLSPKGYGPVPSDLESGVEAQRWARASKATASANRFTRRNSNTRWNPPAAAPSDRKPADIATEDSLVLYKGQLLQASKVRADGWAFGKVVLDVMDERPPIGVDGMSTQAGWFPLSKTETPSAEHFAELHKMMGGGEGASNALKPPDTWESLKDPMAPELKVVPDGAEKQAVVDDFTKTLKHVPSLRVVEVQRIQNMSMWQSYAVKRETVIKREKDESKGAAGTSRFERAWLFHGTAEETVPKIVEMGFNRAFCGKNATKYGKGVYFARDAEYSARKTYSPPNKDGVQHMFVCRIVVGEYCLGKEDALTPDVRFGHQLYDTTVNRLKDPQIFVTYHDAQAYPEYLVKFTQQ
jgi:hypothetical protein